MFDIFAKSLLTATRNDHYNHWKQADRFGDRKKAEIEAHLTARRRD